MTGLDPRLPRCYGDSWELATDPAYLAMQQVSYWDEYQHESFVLDLVFWQKMVSVLYFLPGFQSLRASEMPGVNEATDGHAAQGAQYQEYPLLIRVELGHVQLSHVCGLRRCRALHSLCHLQ